MNERLLRTLLLLSALGLAPLLALRSEAGPPTLPTVSVSDAIATEGQAVVFTVTVTGSLVGPVSVHYGTGDCSAHATGLEPDYAAASGTLAFSLSEPSTKTVIVTTLTRGGSGTLPDRAFEIVLSDPVNAVLGRSRGVGSILDDGGARPRVPRGEGTEFKLMGLMALEGREWSLVTRGVAAPQYVAPPEGGPGHPTPEVRPEEPIEVHWPPAAMVGGDLPELVAFRPSAMQVKFYVQRGSCEPEDNVGATIAAGDSVDATWRIVGASDFGGSASSDILWQKQDTGELKVWFIDDHHKAGEVALTPDRPTPNTWDVIGTGDLDGDHKPDVLFRHKTAGTLVYWLMDGTVRIGGGQLNPSALTDYNWELVGIWDVDGDGMNDLVWQHRTSYATVVWYMNGTTRTGGGYLNLDKANTHVLGPR